jgi:hypothetical protein
VSHQAKELYNSLEILKKAQQGTTCENYNIVNNHQLKAPFRLDHHNLLSMVTEHNPKTDIVLSSQGKVKNKIVE